MTVVLNLVANHLMCAILPETVFSLN